VLTTSGLALSSWLVPEQRRAPRRLGDRANDLTGAARSAIKWLVDEHEGTVRAESDGAGRGAMFTVCLPCARPPEPLNLAVPGLAHSPSFFFTRPAR
jgi:hypothetical protein